jgi:replication factor C subunit 3/5
MNEKLPWAEKFRPTCLDDIISQDHIKQTFKNYIKQEVFPHLLFYGPPGTGKTSTIKAFAKELYKEQYDLMVLEINASEERGIDVVRTKIKDFIITKCSFYGESNLFKLVILDEADAMTNEAQAMLRRVIETYTNNARFCLICNYKSKIIEAVQSRCTMFKFPPLNPKNITKKIKLISEEQHINITDDAIKLLIKVSYGDMRKLLNIYQSINILDRDIDSELITTFLGYPEEKNIAHILKILKGNNISSNIEKLKTYIDKYGFSLQNILTELTNNIYTSIIEDKIDINKASNILNGLANIEINLCSSPNILIQLSTLVSIFYIYDNNI